MVIYAARLKISNAFEDGQLVSIQLLDDLQANGVYIRKMQALRQAAGWLVAALYVDLVLRMQWYYTPQMVK